MNEIKLIKKAKDGDCKAFERLFKMYKKLITSLSNKYRAGEDGEQEGVIALYSAIKKFDYTKGKKFSSYLFWLVNNRLKKYKKNEIGGDNNEIIDQYWQQLDNKLLCKDIMKVLAHDEKELIKLLYYKDLKEKEVAEYWKISRAELKRLKLTALMKLRKAIR